MQQELVERARMGDRDAFAALAASSIARLYNIAQLMLADGDLAQDAVQEALIVAWRDLRSLRDPAHFDAWLYRVLVRSVYREAKRQRRGHVRQITLADAAIATPDPGLGIEDRDQLERGFLRLSAAHRAVLVLHHHVGLADGEAAEVLGVPAGTFKSRLHRATAALRAELDADTRKAERLETRTVR